MLTEDFWENDRHVAMYHYNYEGMSGLEELKKKWATQEKPKELLDYLDELIAKRPNDPVKVLYEEE